MYNLISQDYLIHHGVKGMKWGVRHDREKTGYRNKQTVNSRNSFKISRGTKIALALTGIAAGTAVSLVLIQRGKIHADDIMKAGTKIQTLHFKPELITNGEKFFTTNKSIDKIKYMADFSRGGSKQKITATVSDDIKIAGGDTGAAIYEHLLQTNPEFKQAVHPKIKIDNGYYFSTKYRNYQEFNRKNLLGKPDNATNIFKDELKRRGYDGVADLNDRKGWKTSANILFDNSKLKNIKVEDIKKTEYVKAKTLNNIHRVGKSYINTPYATVAAVGGAAVSSAGIVEDKKINDRMNKKYK